MVQKTEESTLRRCPECGSDIIIKDRDTGEYVCGICGLVVEETFDEGKEWRAYNWEEKEKRSRVGPPLANWLHDKGLPTVIKEINRDAQGKKLSPSMQYQMWRLKRQQTFSRIASTEERNLSNAFSYINLICDNENLPTIIKETAADIYRKVLKEGLVRGRTIKGIATACVYAACRITKNPRSLKDFGKYYYPKDAARYYRFILKELDLPIPIDAPLKYILKIGEKMGMSEQTKNLAIRLVNAAKKKNYTSGKGPRGIAASSLYIAGVLLNEKKTQKEIAEAGGVTEVTIRNRYKDLVELLDFEIKL